MSALTERGFESRLTARSETEPRSVSAHFSEAEIVREERRHDFESLSDEWEREDDRRYYDGMTTEASTW